MIIRRTTTDDIEDFIQLHNHSLCIKSRTEINLLKLFRIDRRLFITFFHS